MGSRIVINPDDAISRRYTVRRAGQGRTLETCVPVEAIEREARRADLSIDEFIKQFEAEFLYNNFGGLHIRFVPREQDEAVPTL